MPLKSPASLESVTVPGVLHPALGSSEHEGHGCVEAAPGKGHRNGKRNETPDLGRQAETVHPREEKVLGRP